MLIVATAPVHGPWVRPSVAPVLSPAPVVEVIPSVDVSPPDVDEALVLAPTVVSPPGEQPTPTPNKERTT
jgi:hypothetical protein